MDKKLEKRLPLGSCWINNQIRMIYNEIKVDTKGKKRGYVTVLFLDSTGTYGIYLKAFKVHPDAITDWVDGDARKKQYGY